MSLYRQSIFSLILKAHCILALVIMLLFSGVVQAQNVEGLEAWMDGYMENALASTPAAGATVLVGQGDVILFAKAYGLSDIENQIPSKVETVYQIGSLTKQFTAVAILQLEERGKLKLSDDITKYLPDYPTHGEVITIADILYHTSGIKNYIAAGYTDSRIAPGRNVNDAEYRLDLTAEEMTPFFEDEALEFKPGTSWNYTNSGYYLAGLIIEKVSGQSYADYVETNLFKKASMSSSYYTDYERIVPDRARGYKVSEGALLNANALSMTIPYAAGALSSSVSDLLKWNAALHGSNKILGKEAYSKFSTPGKLSNGDVLPLNYALGVAAPIRGGHQAIMHPGGINGFSAVLTYFPENELTIAVLTNTYNKMNISFADEVEVDLAAFLHSADVALFKTR